MDGSDSATKLLLGAGFNSVEGLERYVLGLQDAERLGEPEVSDGVYDNLMRVLGAVKPDSVAFNRGLTSNSYRGAGLTVIRDLSELSYLRHLFFERGIDTSLLSSAKIVGHSVTIRYIDGRYESGSFRCGIDITEVLRSLVPAYLPELGFYRVVTIGGVVTISRKNFDKVSRVYKTPLSAVTSFMRETSSAEERGLLSLVCDSIASEEENSFRSLLNEYQTLSALGFLIPTFRVTDGVGAHNFDTRVDEILKEFTGLTLPFDADGVVVRVNDNALFRELGENGNTYLGGFILKTGERFGAKVYSGLIHEIEWDYGSDKLSPRAVISPVTVYDGNTINTVPLYSVGVMRDNSFTVGSRIYFLYDNETGAMLCDEDGKVVSA
jgi:NAD-dependent DNA ligase adenylation domain|nr:MAG TPA: Ligase N family [Caudoviricetes sp.]